MSSSARRAISPIAGLPRSVVIRDVGPRDGLQAEAPLPPRARARVVQALLDSGLRRVEAVSFVSPRAVPAMAGAEEVLAHIERPVGTVITALVPNLRGAVLALDCEVDEITVTVAASEVYNERNVKMTIRQSVETIGAVCALASGLSVPVDAVISCAFGSPYEGDIEPSAVAELASSLSAQGASAITLADTTGMATPRVLSDVLHAVTDALGSGAGEGRSLAEGLGLHMHETRGTGLLNCYAALGDGVSRFDASIGGLGGSPFADQAAGNVATEDLVALLDDLGIATGVDLERLRDASAVTEEVVGHGLQSKVAYAGPRLARA